MRTPSHGRVPRATRVQVLRAWVEPAHDALRPPWAREAEAFDAACTRCGACVDACPTHVLKIAGGSVRVDYADGECTFCGACVAACPEPAFDVIAHDGGERAWNAVARVDATCLARLGVACQSCGDACAAHAIRFRPRIGATPEPRVDGTLCTGCGACVAVCPSSAIEVAARPPQVAHA